MINFVTGFVAVLASFIMDAVEETRNANKIMKLVCTCDVTPNRSSWFLILCLETAVVHSEF